MTLAASRDLLTLVVALEVVSLPAFALVALRRYDGRASEAALKLFLVSVVSTAVMLFGLSLVYGVTGAVHLDRIATALGRPRRAQPGAACSASSLVDRGLRASRSRRCRSTSGRPTPTSARRCPVAAYLSVVSKAAGFVGLVLVLTVGLRAVRRRVGAVSRCWPPLTMTVGNLVALRQRHAVRLLAWSSVAQAGYMLVPLGAAGHAATDRRRCCRRRRLCSPTPS